MARRAVRGDAHALAGRRRIASTRRQAGPCCSTLAQFSTVVAGSPSPSVGHARSPSGVAALDHQAWPNLGRCLRRADHGPTACVFSSSARCARVSSVDVELLAMAPRSEALGRLGYPCHPLAMSPPHASCMKQACEVGGADAGAICGALGRWVFVSAAVPDRHTDSGGLGRRCRRVSYDVAVWEGGRPGTMMRPSRLTGASCC